MSVEIRVPAPEEIDRWFSVIAASFSDELKDEDMEKDKRMLPPDRMLAAYEDGAMIGTAADIPLTLTIPGGELPAAGLTFVGVDAEPPATRCDDGADAPPAGWCA